MALVGRRDGRNFGYGRQLSYTGPKALKGMFGGGHYGTIKTHCDRWLAFVKWCRSEAGPGINDVRQISGELLSDYAAYLRGLIERGDLAISTAQNRLSSVNRTTAALRGDQYVKVLRPIKALGIQRTSVRRSILQGQDREHMKRDSRRALRTPNAARCGHRSVGASYLNRLEPYDEERFVIITAASNSGMVDIHDLWPLVLTAEHAREWVEPRLSAMRAEAMAKGAAVPAMTSSGLQ